MRNLKRVLALALALIMTLGLMVTASAASYPDADQIDAKYTEAVEVLSGLGVFQGQGNGGTTSFAPKAILTRGEVATLVYRILTGDVKDAQVRNYDYTSFEDVKEGQWWTGYITYAANGGYVKGYDGYFNPQAEVTGVQVLAIMLRAIGRGQNGEYEGAAWVDNVLTDARDLGLLTGIATDDLAKGASRELVAQLLFNAITIPNIVTYSALLGYRETPEKQTLGNKTFKLTEINGVVTANEYADLNDTEPLAAGKTMIDGSIYNISTTLDDIGESRRGWAEGKDVLFFEDTGKNVVWDTDKSTNGKAITDKDAGMKLAKAEQYVNFADGESYKASDYRIKYVIDLNDSEYAKLVADCKVANCTENHSVIEHNNGGKLTKTNTLLGVQYSYTKTIGIGKEITALDLELIYDIFDAADKTTAYKLGEVYIGTQSNNDISDTDSYERFVDKYIESANDGVNAKINVNGNYIKVIDNDNDGYADYILQTKYVMAAITDIAKNGTYTVTILDSSKKNVEIEEDEMVAEDELAEGNVIVYALIDGLYNANLAEIVTESIDKKGIDYKAKTITCGDNVYGQSGIAIDEDEFQDAFLYDAFLFDVTDAQTEVDYDLYLDNYGYVRAYTLNKHAYGLGLLTDGYYYTNYKQSEAKVDLVYGNEAETEYDVSTANTTDWAAFIDTDEGNDHGNRGTWDRLLGFQGNFLGAHQFATNVAAYAVGDETISLYEVDNYTNRTFDVKKSELILNEKSALSTQKLTARFNDKALDDTVYATTETVYYYVTNVKGDLQVQSWVGYKNAPKGLSLKAGQDFAYAVYSETRVGTGYYYADVIVIEAKSALSEANFVYYANTKNTNAASYWLKTIEYDEEAGAWDPAAIIDTVKGVTGVPMFYEVNSKSQLVSPITRNFASWNIYASTAVIDRDVHGRDYVYMADDVDFLLADTPVYKLSFNTKQANRWVAYDIDTCSVSQGDDLIYVTDGKDVLYAINVDKSYYTDNAGVKQYFLSTLWAQIAGEYIPTDLEVLLAAALTAATEKGPYTGYVAETVVADNVTAAVDEINYSEALKVLAGLRAEKYADSAKAIAAADKLDAAIDTFINGLVADEKDDIDDVVPAADKTVMATAITAAKDAVDAAAATRTTTTPAEIAAAGDEAVEELKEAYAAAIKAAREDALEDLQDAKTDAMKLDDEYANGSLNSAITLAYEAAVKAVNGAETIADIKTAAEDGVDDIDAIVEDWAAIDAAIAIIKKDFSSGAGIGTSIPDAEQILSDATDVTVSNYTCTGTSPNFNLTADLASGSATYALAWDYTVV